MQIHGSIPASLIPKESCTYPVLQGRVFGVCLEWGGEEGVFTCTHNNFCACVPPVSGPVEEVSFLKVEKAERLRADRWGRRTVLLGHRAEGLPESIAFSCEVKSDTNTGMKGLDKDLGDEKRGGRGESKLISRLQINEHEQHV